MKSITIRFTVTTVTSHKATVDVPDNCDPTSSKGRANVADALHDQHPDCDETFDRDGDPPILHVILPGGAPLPWGQADRFDDGPYPTPSSTGTDSLRLTELSERAARHARRYP